MRAHFFSADLVALKRVHFMNIDIIPTQVPSLDFLKSRWHLQYGFLGYLGSTTQRALESQWYSFGQGREATIQNKMDIKHYIGSMWKPRCRVTSVHECIPGLPMYMCETLDLFEWIRGRGGGDSKTVVWVCISVPIFIIISRSSSQFLLKICYGVLPKFHRRYQELFPLGSWFIAYGRALTA